jgi:hypothetical protein
MRFVTGVLALALSLVVAGNLLAAGDKPAKRTMPSAFDLPKQVTLTADQQAKLDELKKEYGPKLKDAYKAFDSSLSAEQKKARTDAMKAAREAGKRGPEAMKDAQEAMKLTDDQKTKQTAMRSVSKEARDKVMALLTPEQKEQLKKAHGHHHGQPAASN